MILERAKQHNGKVSVSDYESAWSDYKSCMLDRGYKEIKLIRFPHGGYMEAPYKQGTAAQESQYNDDRQECEKSTVTSVNEVYMLQTANPNLYSNQAEAVVDCLHREGLVPKTYTAKDFNEEEVKAQNSEDGKGWSFDATGNPKAQECTASNGYIISDARTEPVEHLW